MRIVLASSSPRRKEIMNLLGLPYEIISYDHEEILDPSKTVYEQCMDISFQKGKIVYDSFNEDIIVISCDTIVVLDNMIYGKPIDRNDAFNMLSKLSNRTHEVVSALTVFVRKNKEERVYKECEKAYVTISDMSDKEINDWIDSGKAFGKAGSYAIQEEFGRFITKVEGDYYTIVGMPLNKLYNILKDEEVYNEL